MVPRYVEGLTSNVQKCEGRATLPCPARAGAVRNTAGNSGYKSGSGRSCERILKEQWNVVVDQQSCEQTH